MNAGWNIRSLVPPAVRDSYYRLFRVKLKLQCWYEDAANPKRPSPPLPPALLRYRVSENLSADEFLRIGEKCAGLVTQHVESTGGDLSTAQRVLDFGCGCGRTVRWLLEQYPNVHFCGADVDREAIEWCKANLAPGSFIVNNPDPPLDFSDQSFDLVYCFSVFTHLNEAMQDRWLYELKRVLKPGGMLLFSVHGEAAANTLDREGLATLRSVGFLHRRSRKLKGILPEWYNTTWHTPDYVVNRLAKHFREVKYEALPGGTQDLVVAKR